MKKYLLTSSLPLSRVASHLDPSVCISAVGWPRAHWRKMLMAGITCPLLLHSADSSSHTVGAEWMSEWVTPLAMHSVSDTVQPPYNHVVNDFNLALKWFWTWAFGLWLWKHQHCRTERWQPHRMPLPPSHTLYTWAVQVPVQTEPACPTYKSAGTRARTIPF